MITIVENKDINPKTKCLQLLEDHQDNEAWQGMAYAKMIEDSLADEASQVLLKANAFALRMAVRSGSTNFSWILEGNIS